MDKIGTLHAPDALCLRQLIGQASNPLNGNVYEVSIMPGGVPHVLSRVAGLQWSATWEELIALAIEAGVDRAPMDAADTPFPGLSLEPPAVAADRWPEVPPRGYSRMIMGTLAWRHALAASGGEPAPKPQGTQFCHDHACPTCAQFDSEMAAADGRPPFRSGDRIRWQHEDDPRATGAVNFDDGRNILIRWDDRKDSGLDPFSYELAAELLRLETAAEAAERQAPPARPKAQVAPPEGLVLTPGPAVSGAVAKGTAAPACSHPATTPQGGVLRDGAPASPPHPFQDRHDACAREGCELTRRTHDLQIVSDPNLHAFEERPAAPAHPFQGSNDACAREGCGAARYQHSPKHGPGWISHPFEEWAAENERTDEPTPRHNTDMDPLEKHLRTDDCWRCPACGDEQEEASHAAPCKREACGGAYLRHFRDPKAQAAQLEGSE